MRIFKSLIILILLLAAAVLTVRFYFLDQTLSFVLRQTGVSDVRVKGVDISLQQVSAAEVRGAFVLAGGDRVTVAVHGVSFHYALLPLLKTATFEKCDIKGLDVTLSPAAGKQAVLPLHLPVRIALVKERLRSRIPVKEFVIRQLRLHGDTLPAIGEKDIRISAAVTGRVLTAELGLWISAERQVIVNMESPDAFHGTATIVFQEKGGPGFKVDLLLLPENVSARTEVDLQTVREFFSLEKSVPEIQGTLGTSITVPWKSMKKKSIELTADLRDFSVSGISAEAVHLRLSGLLEDGCLHLKKESIVQAEGIHSGVASLGSLGLDLGGSMELQDGEWLLHFSKEQKLVLKKLQAFGFRSEMFSMGFGQALQLNVGKNSWAISDTVLTGSALELTGRGMRVAAAPVSCSISGLQKSFPESGVRADIELADLAFSNEQHGILLTGITVRLDYTQEQLNADLLFRPGEMESRLQLQLEHAFDSGVSSVVFASKEALQFSREGTRLSSLVSNWDYPVDLEEGSLVFRVTGEWGETGLLSADVLADLQGGSGYCMTGLFEGLEFRQDLTLFPEVGSRTTGNIFLEHLMAGVDVTDIRSEISFTPSESGALPVVRLDDLEAGLFMGRVSSPEIRFDLNSPDSSFVVDVADMDLKTLVDLMKMDSLHVTGKISGAIPVTVKGTEITVADGELHSDAPGGEIRYTPGNMNQSGITEYALTAVRNLQYNSLTATAAYQASGQLDLDISLLGKSPELDTSRPVRLNIHAEQNLPDLLQSLRFSRGLTEELDKRLKQHYN